MSRGAPSRDASMPPSVVDESPHAATNSSATTSATRPDMTYLHARSYTRVMRASLRFAPLAALLLAACSSTTSPDGGGPPDGGAHDLTAPDLGTDTGTPDTGTPDLGVVDLGAPDAGPDSGVGHIDHLVIIVLENHTFDNLFASYPGAESLSTFTDSTGTF